MRFRDLGLDYETAAHGVQSAIKYEKQNDPRSADTEIKHLRVGIDMRAAEHAGLIKLLIDAGIFSEATYIETMRLAANEELARYTEHVRKKFKLADTVEFR